jgi:hypothetical protein
MLFFKLCAAKLYGFKQYQNFQRVFFDCTIGWKPCPARVLYDRATVNLRTCKKQAAAKPYAARVTAIS